MRLPPERPWVMRALVFGVAAGIALLFVTLAPDSVRPNPDYNDFTSFYQPPAENLVEGRGLVNDDGSPALHNPPGYVFLLSLVYRLADAFDASRAGAVTALTIVIVGLTAVVVHEIASRLFGGRTAVVAALLWATYPVNLIMAVYQFSEVPFALVLAIAVLQALSLLRADAPQARSALLLGVTIGVASLIRPAAIALAVPFIIVLLVQRRDQPVAWRRSAAALVVAGNLALVLPWELWVWAAHDEVIALSTAGEGSVLDGLTVGWRPRDETGTAAMPGGARTFMAEVAFARSSLESMGEIVSYVWERAQLNPFAAVQVVAVKAVRSWYGTNRLELEGWIALVQAGYAVLVAIGARRVWRERGPGRAALVLVLATTAYFWLVTMAVLSIVRYLSPVLGLLLIFAAPLLAGRVATPTPALGADDGGGSGGGHGGDGERAHPPPPPAPVPVRG